MIEADALGETNRIVAGSWKASAVAFSKNHCFHQQHVRKITA